MSLYGIWLNIDCKGVEKSLFSVLSHILCNCAKFTEIKICTFHWRIEKIYLRWLYVSLRVFLLLSSNIRFWRYFHFLFISLNCKSLRYTDFTTCCNLTAMTSQKKNLLLNLNIEIMNIANYIIAFAGNPVGILIKCIVSRTR